MTSAMVEKKSGHARLFIVHPETDVLHKGCLNLFHPPLNAGDKSLPGF